MNLVIPVLAETSYSANTQFTHELVMELATYCMYLLELVCIAIVIATTIFALFKFMKKDNNARVYLLHGFSIALTFKLGAEILRTVTAATLLDIIEVFLLILIKACMVALIERELRSTKEELAEEQSFESEVSNAKFPLLGSFSPLNRYRKNQGAPAHNRPKPPHPPHPPVSLDEQIQAVEEELAVLKAAKEHLSQKDAAA